MKRPYSLGLLVLVDGDKFGVSIFIPVCPVEFISQGKVWNIKTNGGQNMELLKAIFSHAIGEPYTNND